MPTTERVLVRAFKALDLRVAGETYRAIAKVTKVSVKQAWDDVHGALVVMSEQRGDAVDKFRELENSRLDMMWLKTFGNILAAKPDKKTGIIEMDENFTKAMNICLRISARRARLNGFDAPPKAPVDKDGHVVPPELKRTINVLAMLNREAPEAFDKFVEVTTVPPGENGTAKKKTKRIQKPKSRKKS